MDPDELEFDGFEWDPEKAWRNQEKHGISFEEAQEAVDQAELVSDPYRTGGENRLLVIGPTSMGRMLQVVITLRGKNARLISARRYRA